jgi:hypothetical protein
MELRAEGPRSIEAPNDQVGIDIDVPLRNVRLMVVMFGVVDRALARDRQAHAASGHSAISGAPLHVAHRRRVDRHDVCGNDDRNTSESRHEAAKEDDSVPRGR